MRNEEFSLEMVRLYTERISLQGHKDQLLTALRRRDYSGAMSLCNDAIRACMQKGKASGKTEEEIRASLPYRQLFHLYQMLENFIVCLEEPKDPILRHHTRTAE